ncbi:MAG TPA: DMT family transporter [Anaeromyxobacter sp.]|nr:DMT family transporter [Anaeromyxobacter sp.]
MVGHVFALATAVAWASAVVLFKQSGEHYEAIGLNYLKSVVALLLFALTLPFAGISFFPKVPVRDLLLMLGSGVLGIAISDTLFFRQLKLLGAGRAAIVDCLYSPFVVLASMAWLGDRPSAREAGGGLLVVSAVLLTGVRQNSLDVPARDLRRGIALGVLAMASTAVAIVVLKPILPRYPVLWTTSVRLVGGVLGLSAAALFDPGSRGAFAALAPQRAWRVALPAAFLGNYLALALWVAGFRYGDTASAAILNQTSTLFIVVLAAVFLRERFTAWHALATGLAFAGAAVVVW